MGLCLFSGPTWEKDSLNKINRESVHYNSLLKRKRTPLLNTISVKIGEYNYENEK